MDRRVGGYNYIMFDEDMNIGNIQCVITYKLKNNKNISVSISKDKVHIDRVRNLHLFAVSY